MLGSGGSLQLQYRRKYSELQGKTGTLWKRKRGEEMEPKVVKHSKLGLNWLGKTVTLDRECLGEGIVVGYSSITGEPLAYFYSGCFGDRICAFSHKSVISVAE